MATSTTIVYIIVTITTIMIIAVIIINTILFTNVTITIALDLRH